MCVCVHLCVLVCVCVYICVCWCVCVCTFVCAGVCVLSLMDGKIRSGIALAVWSEIHPSVFACAAVFVQGK